MWRKTKALGCSFMQQTPAGIQLLQSPSYSHTQRWMWTPSQRNLLVLIEGLSSNRNVSERGCLFSVREKCWRLDQKQICLERWPLLPTRAAVGKDASSGNKTVLPWPQLRRMTAKLRLFKCQLLHVQKLNLPFQLLLVRAAGSNTC